MNGLFATDAFKKIVSGAVIGAALTCAAWIFSLSFMGHGGTGPIELLTFLQIAGAGALVGAVFGAVVRLVDGPTGSLPSDADGEILRGLAGQGLDFSQVHTIHYIVAFESWPPPHDAIETLRSMYGEVKLVEPDGVSRGQARFQIRSFVSYEMVTSIQRSTGAAIGRFGGTCKSWGVTQSAA